MSMTEVQWGRSEDGYAESKCGRFRIIPIFAGRVQPIWYQVIDKETGDKAQRDTQHECKAWSHARVNPPPMDLQFWPKITDDML